MENEEWSVELEGRDRITVRGRGDGRTVEFVGCASLAGLLEDLRTRHGKDPAAWPEPEGDSHDVLLVRELVARLNDRWQPVSSDLEVCHCRNVSTKTVDEAILSGAHSTETVSRWTSASTGCGTCRPLVQAMITARIGKRA